MANHAVGPSETAGLVAGRGRTVAGLAGADPRQQDVAGLAARGGVRVARLASDLFLEVGPVQDVIKDARHPYTHGLMGSIPKILHDIDRLTQIDGAMPRLTDIPPGCAFNPRCPRAMDRCLRERPELVQSGPSQAACWALEGAANE